MRIFDDKGQPTYRTYKKGEELPRGYSVQPYFPGYTFEGGKSIYRDTLASEGGYVYSEPGMYSNVAVLDVASMHPTSVIEEKLFGPYTKTFEDILNARLAIKHKEFDKARTMLGGKLAKYLDDEAATKGLSDALKIAINSVYGLTAARFDNAFRDPRNKDNIVAKRGALFMIDLQHAVQERGFTVAHIKTDSIKIPNATNEIISFVTKFGKEYGYTFEHEATYERFCLVNDAVFVAREGGTWSATGAQFQVPYVFKTIFTKEPIVFDDLCETKQVTSALYLRFGEELRFVGRIGRFCPMKEGGGELLRESTGKDGEKKYDSAVGSKGYLWMESEAVKALGLEHQIDRGYYDKQVDKAYETMSAFGDVEWFLSGDPLPWEGEER